MNSFRTRAAMNRRAPQKLRHGENRKDKAYDTIGLYHAATSAGLTLTQGGNLVMGREEMRRTLQVTIGQEPAFQVAKRASWTLRALSGGYAVEAGKTETTPGPYRLIGEALESYAALSASQEAEVAPNRFTKDGRPYLSSLVKVPRWRTRENACV